MLHFLSTNSVDEAETISLLSEKVKNAFSPILHTHMVWLAIDRLACGLACHA